MFICVTLHGLHAHVKPPQCRISRIDSRAFAHSAHPFFTAALT